MDMDIRGYPFQAWIWMDMDKASYLTDGYGWMVLNRGGKTWTHGPGIRTRSGPGWVHTGSHQWSTATYRVQTGSMMQI